MNQESLSTDTPGVDHEATSANPTATAQLNVHLAEYSALTNRCTYWLAFQVPIWTALIVLLGLVPLLWPHWDHLRLVTLTGIGSQLIILLWFQSIEEQYLAISYLERQLRPKVEALIATPQFWNYEGYSSGRRDPLSWWGEWSSPVVTVVGLLLLAVWALAQPKRLPGDYAFTLFLGGNVVLTIIQFRKTLTRIRLRRSISDPSIPVRP